MGVGEYQLFLHDLSLVETMTAVKVFVGLPVFRNGYESAWVDTGRTKKYLFIRSWHESESAEKNETLFFHRSME
jgi:hypothetical protein